MKYSILSITLILMVMIGCNKIGSNGPNTDTKALLDSIVVTESYNAAIENPDDTVTPNSTKHKREDCPNGGWITQGDGHRSRCPDCDPPYSTAEDELQSKLEEAAKQLEAEKAAAAEAIAKVEADAKAKLEAEVAATKARVEAEAKAQFDAEVQAREAKAKLEAEQKAAAEALKAGVAAEPNEPVPSVGEQLAIEAAKMKLEREAREAAEAKAKELEEKVRQAEVKALGLTAAAREDLSTYLRTLDNDARYNFLRKETQAWNEYWRDVKAGKPDTKVNKEVPGKGEAPVKPVGDKPAVTFDPALDWRLPAAERKRTFEECKLSWKTANGKCCPDCTCDKCYCMYPGQCLVEANGGNPVTKYTNKVERQCSGGSCKNVTVQVPRITYKQPSN